MTTHETLLKSLEHIKLSPEARSRMRAELSAYADFHTVPTTPILSPYQHLRSFVMHFPFVLAALLLVVTGTGIAYGAHDALPGSSLYSVKLGVLEPIEGVFTRHQTAADWSLVLAQRRLTEADIVTNAPESSSAAQAQAADEVAKAAQVVEKDIEVLPNPAKTEAQESFTSSVSTHEETLVRLAGVGTSTERVHREGKIKKNSVSTTTQGILTTLLTKTRAEQAAHAVPAFTASHTSRTEHESTDTAGSASTSAATTSIVATSTPSL